MREPFDVVVVAPRVILPDGERPCAIAIVGAGQIAAVELSRIIWLRGER